MTRRPPETGGSSGLRVELHGGVLRLRFTHPERRNPFTGALRRGLTEALSRAVADGLRVVLVIAAPSSSAIFSAGADLADIDALEPADAPGFAEQGQALHRLVEDLPALVLAGADGACFGGALDFVLSCDLVAASERARFAHPGARLGIVTGWGGTRRLPRATTEATAASLFAAGRGLDAEGALACGLATLRLPGQGPHFSRACEGWAADWSRRLEGVETERIGTLKRLLASAAPARDRLEAPFLRRLALGCEVAPTG